MSLNIGELKASITIDTGELQEQLNQVHDKLTSYNGIFGKLGMKVKSWIGERKFEKIQRAAQDAALGCIIDLRYKAKDETPWDTHALMESMYIEEVGAGTTSRGFEVGYDKDNAQNIRDVYGIIQHEVTSFNHPRGGKARFLEDPYNANIMKYKEKIRDAIQEAVR